MRTSAILALAATLLAVQTSPAAQPAKSPSSEIAREMEAAAQEVRTETAQARAQLNSENLSLGDGLHLGKESNKKSIVKNAAPKAVITPQGDFLIDGEAVPVDAQQRRQLLDYRSQVIAVAKISIDGGERAAMAALEATNLSLFALITGGLSGSLERRVEASAKEQIEPFARQICQRMPKMLESQQRLAASLPEFRPYATLERDDVEDCEGDIRNELATYGPAQHGTEEKAQ